MTALATAPARRLRVLSLGAGVQSTTLALMSAIDGMPFLHASLVPLDQVDFSTWSERGQADLFGEDCTGSCGV